MSQSINLANVDAVNFNGSSVEKINLNGSEVWIGTYTQDFTIGEVFIDDPKVPLYSQGFNSNIGGTDTRFTYGTLETITPRGLVGTIGLIKNSYSFHTALVIDVILPAGYSTTAPPFNSVTVHGRTYHVTAPPFFGGTFVQTSAHYTQYLDSTSFVACWEVGFAPGLERTWPMYFPNLNLTEVEVYGDTGTTTQISFK